MLQGHYVIITGFFYLLLLFFVAFYAEKRAKRGRSLIKNPYIYSLSIAVYCTAWTFYGSVERAATSGLNFLSVYIGPTIMAFLWTIVLRKIIRISKNQRITSIADFISSRYGKSLLLGGLVTIISLVGIMPYISLQLKAVAVSLNVLMQYPDIKTITTAAPILSDSAFYVAGVMALFTILFGTRYLDAFERHEGMVAAVAFESLVKLVAFLLVGLSVTYGIYNGFGDIFNKAKSVPHLQQLFTFKSGDFNDWFWIIFMSSMAIMFLPRQFQVMVVENTDENHVEKATWIFPFYILLINLFVLPIAFGGMLHFSDGSVRPDTFVLTLPMSRQWEFITLVAFIGGLSAATSMVMVTTISISTMISNNLILPFLMQVPFIDIKGKKEMNRFTLRIRRISIIAIMLLGYLSFRLIGESYALVTIGLMSFAAAAQFAPSIIGGIFWKQGNKLGALVGLAGGFALWLYTMFLPALAKSGWLPASFIESGPFGITLLNPYSLFGVKGMSWISHGMFWSILVNLGAYITISVFTRHGSTLEQTQAALFTGGFQHETKEASWSGDYSLNDLQKLLTRFMGQREMEKAFAEYTNINNIPLHADPELAGYMEKRLAGAIGTSSARIMISSIVSESVVGMEEIIKALDDELMESRRLKEEIHKRKAAEEQLLSQTNKLTRLKLRHELILNSAGDGIYGVDLEGRTTFINPAAVKLIGWGSEDMIGKLQHDVIHHTRPDGSVYPAEECPVYRTFKEDKAFHVDDEVFWRKDRTSFPVEYVSTPMHDDKEQLVGAVVVFKDISERKEMEQRLCELAHYDILTGLPNRMLFYEMLDQAIEMAGRNGLILGIMFIDLDRFKYINDTLGHDTGDLLLKEVGARFEEILRQSDTVARNSLARIGGDEFLILLHNLVKAQNAAVVAKKIISSLIKPFNIKGNECFIGASVGVSIYPFDGETPEVLIKHADSAMYQAKYASGNSYQFYSEEIETAACERLAIENDLRHAIDKNEFILYYQPVVDVMTGKTISAEALIRWKRNGEIVPPDVFIPVAEETGLILYIGEWVLKQACHDIRKWREEGFLEIHVAVNMSMCQFGRQKNLVEGIAQIIFEADIKPEYLELEITESACMENITSLIPILRELNSTGIKLSIDDFGTGYSSLSYLKYLPIGKLKIDRSFIKDIIEGEDDQAIVKAMTGMAHTLGLKAVAEGVETLDHLEISRSLGCDYVQGYLFSKPVPEAEFLTYLRDEVGAVNSIPLT